MKTDKVVIIGCGGIGRRHLQAALALNKSLKIFLYDCLEIAIADTCCFVKEIGYDIDKTNITIIKDYNNLLKTSQQSLVIIATTAKDRALLIKDIAKTKPIAIFAEKPLTQGYQEYQELLENKDLKSVNTYLNFSRHLWPIYINIMKDITRENLFNSTSINCMAKNVGFGCNGIHYIELACWLLKAKDYNEVAGEVDNKFLSNKRGKEYIDFTGRLIVKFNNGTYFYLNSMPEGNEEVTIQIQNKEISITIWEGIGMQAEYNDRGEISFSKYDTPFVSQTSQTIISDLLIRGETKSVPTICEAALAHKILFDYLYKYTPKELFDISVCKTFPIT